MALRRARSHVGVYQPQVIEDRAGDYRYDNVAHPKADAPLLQVSHHAGCGIQAIGAAAAQEYRVHLLHHVSWAQKVRFPRARRGTTHIHPAYGPFRAQQDGASGGMGLICVVAYADAGHVRYGAGFSAHRQDRGKKRRHPGPAQEGASPMRTLFSPSRST